MRDMGAGSRNAGFRLPGAHLDANRARAHLSALHGLPEVLDRFGQSTDLILRCAGLSRELFEDPNRSASFVDLDRLIDTCLKRTNCPHFGLLLGRRVTLESLGLLGRLARHSMTVGQALAELERFFPLHDSGGTLQVTVAGGQASLIYGIRVPDLKHDDQIYDIAAMAACNILRQLCGDRFRPSEVLLPHRRPHEPHPYTEAFQAPVRFNAMQCAIVFRASFLSRPVPGADELLHSLLADHATHALAESHPLLFDDVRRAIADSLATGDCSRAGVARRLGLHQRTFGRRLQAAGTTFQAIRDELRMLMARQLLHDTDTPVARVATSLGYADSTVFSRSFRRWTGVTPREFRAHTARPH